MRWSSDTGASSMRSSSNGCSARKPRGPAARPERACCTRARASGSFPSWPKFAQSFSSVNLGEVMTAGSRDVLILALLAMGITAPTIVAQAPVDSSLASYIAGIRAVDNHAHPMRAIRVGAPADTEFDALPLDALPPFNVPWRLRTEHPEWPAGRHALYGIGGYIGRSVRHTFASA